jgi:hypothetical protein
METKYNPPSKLTAAPYGTLYKVIGETKVSKTQGDIVEYQIYVQTSRNEADIKWVELGDLLAQVYEHKLLDPNFLKDILHMYEKMGEKDEVLLNNSTGADGF